MDPFRRHVGVYRAAVVLDHWVPRERGGLDDEANYVGLCASCHDHKRQLESRGVVQRAEDLPRGDVPVWAAPGM